MYTTVRSFIFSRETFLLLNAEAVYRKEEEEDLMEKIVFDQTLPKTKLLRDISEKLLMHVAEEDDEEEMEEEQKYVTECILTGLVWLEEHPIKNPVPILKIFLQSGAEKNTPEKIHNRIMNTIKNWENYRDNPKTYQVLRKIYLRDRLNQYLPWYEAIKFLKRIETE